MHLLQLVFMLGNGLSVVSSGQASHLMLCCSNGAGLLQHIQLVLGTLKSL